MGRYLTFILLICCAASVHAQFNDSTYHRLNLGVSGSINKANGSTAYLLNNSLGFSIKKSDFVFNSSNNWIYGRQNNQLTNNDYSSILNFNLYKTIPHFYYWGLANYNTSYSLKINDQLLAGLGIAYSILDRPNAYFNISDGILYDKSNLLGDLNYDTWRNSFRIQYHFAIKDLVTLDGSNFLQSAYADKNDYIIRANTVLGIKLRKWISLTSSLTYNKMNITRSDNLIFTYGISLDKYF